MVNTVRSSKVSNVPAIRSNLSLQASSEARSICDTPRRSRQEARGGRRTRGPRLPPASPAPREGQFEDPPKARLEGIS